MPTPSIQTLTNDAQQVLNLESISAVRSVVAATLANANTGTPLNPNLTTQQLWNEFYQIVTQPKSDIESIIANQLMKFMYAPPAPGGVGADKQVIFNDGGVLAGDPQFLWNKTTNLLTVTGSATITGDLTVATDRLKVVTGSTAIQTGATTQLQVGTTSWPSTVIGKSGSRSLFGNTGEVAIWNEAAPAIGNYSTLFVTAKTGAGATTMGGLQIRAGIENASNSDGFVSLWTTNSVAGGFVERYKIDSTGISTWSVAGTTAMTLNASGLGIGMSPANNLSIGSATYASFGVKIDSITQSSLIFKGTPDAAGYEHAKIVSGRESSPFTYGSFLAFYTEGKNSGTTDTSVERLRIDSSGNVGIGVTPSAWGAGNKFIDINSSAAFGAFGASDAMMIGNAYWDGSSWIRKTANNAWRFVIESVSSTPTMTWQLAANGSAGSSISSWTQAMTLDASGNLLVGQTAQSVSTVGASLNSNGAIVGCVNGAAILYVNRKVDDGTLVSFLQDNTEEGTISVSGNTVSYNNFAGSHASQLQDGSKTEILRGTVMESINELCVWPNEENERLPKAKISDTAGSKKVYGVFMAWDNEWTITNDFLVTAVGAFICRVNGSVTVQEGDLLESNGDGTARVQADDIIRSSTIGKVTSTVKTHQYDDGSYCVPTVLYCG